MRAPLSPPTRSTGLLSDIRQFLLHRPRVRTPIDASSHGGRENYTQRIRQRLGVTVADYSVLNVHRIGIQAPASLVFEELQHWKTSSSCWPNHLARLDLIQGFEEVRILLFGLRKYPFGFKKSFFGLKFIPLFRLSALKTQSVPPSLELDNARYVLFRCGGGYPVGIFGAYVRSSVTDMGEVEPTQFFMIVGFNFYGRQGSGKRGLVGSIWETIHDRVTSNVMIRFKELCEWRFEKIQGGG